MEECKIKNLYNLDETIAKDLLEKFTYPWEVLPNIAEYIIELGNKLDKEKYEKKGEDIWIAKSANVYPSAYIKGPAIIGENAEIRHCSFIRGKVIVGNGAVVGNSTELKNVILFMMKDQSRSVERSCKMKRWWLAIGFAALAFSALAFCAPGHVISGWAHHPDDTACQGRHCHGGHGGHHCR